MRYFLLLDMFSLLRKKVFLCAIYRKKPFLSFCCFLWLWCTLPLPVSFYANNSFFIPHICFSTSLLLFVCTVFSPPRTTLTKTKKFSRPLLSLFFCDCFFFFFPLFPFVKSVIKRIYTQLSIHSYPSLSTHFISPYAHLLLFIFPLQASM